MSSLKHVGEILFFHLEVPNFYKFGNEIHDSGFSFQLEFTPCKAEQKLQEKYKKIKKTYRTAV